MKVHGWMMAVAGMVGVSTWAHGQQTEFLQLSLMPDVQMQPPSAHIEGLRLSIWSENAGMRGADLGIVNQTLGDFTGFALNLVSTVEGDASGVLLHPFGYGRVGGDFTGWHGAGLFSYLQGSATGFQSSMVSRTLDDFSGLQLGLIYAETGDHISGVQAGIVNRAASVKGLQLGLVNMTDEMYGVQIGLINYIRTGALPVFVIANAKF